MGYLRHDDAYNLDRLSLGIAQGFGNVVRVEVVLRSKLLYCRALVFPYTFASAKCTGYGGNRHSELLGNVLHSCCFTVVHRVRSIFFGYKDKLKFLMLLQQELSILRMFLQTFAQ